MKKNGIIKNSRGVTLVELLISLALVGVVLSIAVSVFLFGNTSFRSGSSQYDLQAKVRFALFELTEDVRFAKEMTILTAGDINIGTLTAESGGIYPAVSAFDTYIFYDPSENAVVKLSRSNMEKIILPTDAASPLTFTAVGTPANTLHFQVSGQDNKQSRTFNVESEILMLNKPSATGTTGVGVRYTSPDAYISRMQWPEATLSGVNNDKKLEIIFDALKPIRLFEFEVIPGANSNQLQEGNVKITPENTFTSKLTIDFFQIGGNPKNFVDGDQIAIIVEFGTEASPEYQAYYSVTYVGGSTKAWRIE